MYCLSSKIIDDKNTHLRRCVHEPSHDRAKKLYSRLLGAAPYVDETYYVGFKVGDQEIGLDPNGHNTGMSGPVGYWQVKDIKQSLQSLLEAGAKTQQEVKDVGGGKLVASVRDADGNVIGLIQEAGK